MKKIILKSILPLMGLMFCLGLNAQDEGLQYTVIHHEGALVEIHDSIVDPSTGYTIEDFIEELGLDAGDIEIIEITDEMEFIGSDSEIWIFSEEECEDGIHSQNIEIIIDGDEIEGEEGEIVIEKIIESENEFTEGEESVVIVKTMMISDEDIELGDIDIEELMENGEFETIIIEELENGDTDLEMEMEMDVKVEKFIDENGEEQTFMWINGEEVDPDDYEENQFIFEGGDLPEGAEIIILEEGDCADFEFIEMGSESFTLAIVAPVDMTIENEERLAVEENSNIENLKFNPNGSGQYLLSFDSKSAARTQIVIYDLQGREVYSRDLGKFEGNFNEDLNMDLSSGAYVLNILQNDERVVKKIIVQ